MSFSLLPIAEIKLSDRLITNSISEFREEANRVVDFAHLVDENFLLILLLTSSAELVLYYRSGASTRLESIPIKHLFPQKIFPSPALVSLTDDCSLVVILLCDGKTILLVPFRALVDVTWAQKSSLLASKPISFSLFDSTLTNEHELANQLALQFRSAICFNSFAGHTYFLFGTENGFLYIVDLNFRKIAIKISLQTGIHSLRIYDSGGSHHLLVSQTDKTQLMLPIESKESSIRETLISLSPSQIHPFSENYYFIPQNGGIACALDSRNDQLVIFNSIPLLTCTSPTFFLKNFPSQDIQQVLLTPKMVIALNRNNKLFVHLRFLQSNSVTAHFEPFEVSQTSINDQCEKESTILGLIPSLFGINGGDHLECLVATEFGIYSLRASKTSDAFILDHLCSHFFSVDCLSSIADTLHIQPTKLCLSLLRSSLRNSSSSVDESTIARIDGILTLSFKFKVEPTSLLSVLRECGQEDMLLPFLRIKHEKNPSDHSLRQLFLGALLARIAHVHENETKTDCKERELMAMEKETIECELRHFLLKFDVNESDILLVLLKNQLWTCVCVLLCRNATVHSATVARFLLELPNWKTIKNIDSLLKCLSYIHWASVESYAPTILVKLFNLVPFFKIAQLKIVYAIAHILSKRSIESANSLLLVCALCLHHLVYDQNEPHFHRLSQPKIVDCGSNCTVLLAEDAYGIARNGGAAELSPFFWGEFSAGTLRLLRSDQSKRSSPLLTRESAIKGRRDEAIEKSSTVPLAAASESKKCDKKVKSAFAFVPFPRSIALPSKQLEIHSVACGTEHIVMLAIDGRVFVWGRNRYGQCGIGSKEPVTHVTELIGNWGRVINVYAGHYHSGLITEVKKLYLWGWGLHGQLGNGSTNDMYLPTETSLFNELGDVKLVCLGYSHTLALYADGRVYGCGALAYGQLGIDPHDLEGNPIKMKIPIQLMFPAPISHLSSNYFHGIALSKEEQKTVLYEWGESPQSLKMKMFLLKRLRMKEKTGKGTNDNVSKEESIEECEEMQQASSTSLKNEFILDAQMPIDLPRDHLRIRKLCEWREGVVKALSAGFNHSALLTTDGELFTWGKSLEAQLGHQNRKEKAQPTKVEEPKDIRWAEVVCARNFTTAFSTGGQIYAWGRNDKFQLGLGSTLKKQIGHTRKIALKSDKGSAQRSIELPADNCVETPTLLPGLKAFTEDSQQAIPAEAKLKEMLFSANQLSINALSRFLLKHPLPNFCAVQAHLMSGDLLAALHLLILLGKKDNLLELSNTMSPSRNERPVAIITQTKHLKGSPSSKSGPILKLPGSSFNQSSNNAEAKRSVAVKLRNTYCSSSQDHHITKQQQNTEGCSSHQILPSSKPVHQLEQFHSFVDKIWELIRIHPLREVQTVALVELLYHRFPIYNRLAADLRLSRLVSPFVSLTSSTSEHCTSSSSGGSSSSFFPKVRLMELGVSERSTRLRQAKLPDIGGQNFKSLKSRCEKLIAQDRFRFFSDCGHFEKCIIESGPSRSELISLQNRLRRCSKCVGRNIGNTSK